MKTSRILGALAVALALGCGRHPKADEATGPAVRVQTAPVELQQIADIYDAVGTVRPKVGATVAAKVMAAIREIPVKPGDAVAAGQLLAQLDDRELRAEFDRAKADFDRFSALLEKQAVTRAEFDAVQSRYRVAEATWSYAAITAPFAGVVAQKLGEVGDLTAPGKPLFVIEQTGVVRLETPMPERLAGKVAVGQRVPVTVDATGEVCAGTVSEIVPAADAASRSFLVKIDLACRQPLKSGMFGRAAVPVGQRAVLLAPATAVHQRGQLTFVYVVSEGRAGMRLVKTGQATGDALELLAGAQAGDRVITSAAGTLADGQRIEPR